MARDAYFVRAYNMAKRIELYDNYSNAAIMLLLGREVKRMGRNPGRLLALGMALLIGVRFVHGQTVANRTASPTTTPEGVRALRDLQYVRGGHERNRLDLYLPEKATGPLPVIVWVHGGGWTSGDKSHCPAIHFATKGFAIASINYRFSQHAIFPAQIYDCKAAVRWLRANAEKYGLDPKHIGAWGGSAGGQLVMLLGTTAGVKELEGPGGNADQSSSVQAVVDWFGPSDFLTLGPKDTRTKLLGGDALQNKQMAVKASPITYVSSKASPFLIMHGDQDHVVQLSQSETFARALKDAGVEATLVVVQGAGHSGPKFTSRENLKDIEEFFSKHLGKPIAGSP
jgi:acetyl esterase/lipase